jgi:hypothetical protein
MLLQAAQKLGAGLSTFGLAGAESNLCITIFCNSFFLRSTVVKNFFDISTPVLV